MFGSNVSAEAVLKVATIKAEATIMERSGIATSSVNSFATVFDVPAPPRGKFGKAQLKVARP
jgi:hypothetical protein